jgi:AraC-like DNA-binding protein
MSDTLPLVDAALRGALIAWLLLLARALRHQWPGRDAARAGFWLCLGLCVQTIGSAPAVEWNWPPPWQAPLVAIAVGNAVLFWLFVRTLFDDDFRLRPLHGLAWLGAASLGAVNAGWFAGSGSPLAPWTFTLQRTVAIACAAAAVWAVARHWRGDLVERRRGLRAWIAGVGIVYTLVQVALRIGSGTGMLTASGALLDVCLMLLLVGAVAWHTLRLEADELFDAPATARRAAPARVPPAPALVDPADERLAEALLRLMRTERAFADEDIGLARLAQRLSVPEYRLRRVIHQRLGHRHFNAFVNTFRLDEARTALADRARRELPVLTIALEAGFQSIGPFNRAFKALTGLTPTEFRRQNIADS